MARSKRDQMMLYGLLAVVPLYGVYYLYDNQYQEYLQWAVEIEELNGKIREAEEAAGKLERLHEEEARLSVALDSALQRLPRKTDITQILETVEALAREAAVDPRRIETKNIRTPVAEGIYNRHPISLGGIKNLTPQAIADLLTRLQNYEKIFATNSITLTKDPTTNRFRLEIELETYTTSDEGDAGGGT